jgi:hypothetical protein
MIEIVEQQRLESLFNFLLLMSAKITATTGTRKHDTYRLGTDRKPKAACINQEKSKGAKEESKTR